jgi:hypothetical protein
MSQTSIPAFGSVVLSAEVVVDGLRYQVREAIPLQHWNACGEDYQNFQKADLLRSLGECVVKRLAPEIVVTMPEPSLNESLRAELHPFDHPEEY